MGFKNFFKDLFIVLGSFVILFIDVVEKYFLFFNYGIMFKFMFIESIIN